MKTFGPLHPQRQIPGNPRRLVIAGVSSIPKTSAEITIQTEKEFILQTYARPEVVFTHGRNARLWDSEGSQYIDFTAGIAVNALGHGDPRWLEALTTQAAKLAHVSNLYHTEPQAQLAKNLLEETSWADRVFYANTGTEANEAAIKFARKAAKVKAGIDPYDPNVSADAPYEIVSFTGSFHGRTMGALALTYKDQYKTPFAPLMPGAMMTKYNDLDAAAEVIKKGKTAAVFVEPVQGEGGINPCTVKFLQGLRALCDEAGALLVFDEVQCGLGRTGKLWGHQHFAGISPDMMTLAKPLAGGLPIGAVLLTQAIADCMKPGDHGSTFAGNPLVCATALAVFDIIKEPTFLESVAAKGEYLASSLREALKGNPHVLEVRSSGLMCGIQLDQQAGAVVEASRNNGLLVITAGSGDVVRLVPPLTITQKDIEEGVDILVQAINASLK